MKDQYVGDVNDYAKYQLLRLAAPHFEPLIVAWMLTAGDGRGDGARIGYLSDPAWRTTDPELYDELAALVAAGERSVAAVERLRSLAACEFDPRPMPHGHEARSAHFAALAERATSDSLVFFDPDNGLEVPSAPKHRRGAERYLFWDELAPLRERGASVLVYQHFPRVPRPAYVERMLGRLGGEMGDGYTLFAAHTSLVAFLFAIREERATPLRDAVSERCAESTLLSFASRNPASQPA